MNEDIKHRYEHYQLLMSFLCEELPAKNWSVIRMIEADEKKGIPAFPNLLQGNRRENLVRAFLRLPTVQHDRKVADDLVKEIQARANK